MEIQIKETKDINKDDIIELYKKNKWSSVSKPDQLYNALLNSHCLVSAWDGNKLIGIGNAISDGHLVVYFPHLLVHPDYQGKGVGTKIVEIFKAKYKHFHQQILVADGKAIEFYKKSGFTKAGRTESMWIYEGNDH